MRKNVPKDELIRRARRSLTRLARFTNRLQRTGLGCGPITVQQCHTLEALTAGPMTMTRLADEVAIHQSTLTRIVEKLEERKFVERKRLAENQRSVAVTLTQLGRATYLAIDRDFHEVLGQILSLVKEEDRVNAVHGLEILCDLLDPHNSTVQQLIKVCEAKTD